jgi:hypothetical protein
MARQRLIEAVKTVYPDFLGKLSTDVFLTYQRLADGPNAFRKLRHSTNTWELLPEIWRSANAWKVLPTNCELRTSLGKWATKVNANDPSLLHEALLTLRGWHGNPPWRADLRWHPILPGRRRIAIGEKFVFGCEGWDLTLRSWAEYSVWARRRFEEALSDYGTKTRKLAAKSCPPLLLARRVYSQRNLEWFTLYQFAGLAPRTILERYAKTSENLDQSTVSKGIKTAAKLLRWTCLRPAKKTQVPPQLS